MAKRRASLRVNSDGVFQGPVMTTDEAAAYLRVSRRTLERWTVKGRLRRYNIRGHVDGGRPMWRYRKDDLDRFLTRDAPDCPAGPLDLAPAGAAG